MRFLFVVDLHGDEESYETALAAAREREAVAIVNGGDLLPHGLRNAFAGQRDFLGWLRAHWSAARAAGIASYAMFGNDDARALAGELDGMAGEGIVTRLDGGGWLELGGSSDRGPSGAGWTVLGFPWVPDPPFRLKDWCRHDDTARGSPPQFGTPLVSTSAGLVEVPADALSRLPTIEDELAALPAPPDPARAILVAHGPPAGIGLGTTGDRRDVGSHAVARFLERSGFPLSLHGHIHESPHVSGRWWGRLGKTVCVNPGAMERPPWVVVDLDARTVEHRTMGLATF
ncbi:MAG: metallophosphoesterase [Deltaproteobacteria bacterium]|nr:metallophosphoesterase [Deltaproteobacteria bacterium]